MALFIGIAEVGRGFANVQDHGVSKQEDGKGEKAVDQDLWYSLSHVLCERHSMRPSSSIDSIRSSNSSSCNHNHSS